MSQEKILKLLYKKQQLYYKDIIRLTQLNRATVFKNLKSLMKANEVENKSGIYKLK